MSIDFEREQRWWDTRAPREEIDVGDEPLNRALRWREIQRHLDGVVNILDIGAGCGAFSIPLAKTGFRVTHLDFSPKMLAQASNKAELLGLNNIEFVSANATDLSRFEDCFFDLVLNMDGAISFSGDQALRALGEAIRVTKRTLVVTVSNMAALIPYWVICSLESLGKIAPAVEAMLERGRWDPEEFVENRTLARALLGGYLGPIQAFLPETLRDLFKDTGMEVIRCGGIGSLSYLCAGSLQRYLEQHPDAFENIVELSERFDLAVMPGGPGTQQRAGLICVARRVDEGSA